MGPLLFGIFIVLHGLVHLLYMGQSQRFFELQPGMLWPDGSWALAKLLGEQLTRTVASVALVVAAVVFAAGGLGLILKQNWWRPLALGAAVFSTVIYLLLWDGAFSGLDNKGGVGILINLAILAVVLILRWPTL